ncbi:MAG: hypothetical protein C0524_09015 [Rhodobacter sp.]|nr:hypothetical protein [Rhodobacter sp.]
MSLPIAPGHRLSCDFSVSDGIGTVVLWVLLTIVTLGLALFVAPYYILQAPINRTSLIDPAGQVVGRLHVDVHLSEIVGHALVWVLLTIVTLGLALILYQFAVLKRMLNAVVVR